MWGGAEVLAGPVAYLNATVPSRHPIIGWAASSMVRLCRNFDHKVWHGSIQPAWFQRVVWMWYLTDLVLSHHSSIDWNCLMILCPCFLAIMTN